VGWGYLNEPAHQRAAGNAISNLHRAIFYSAALASTTKVQEAPGCHSKEKAGYSMEGEPASPLLMPLVRGCKDSLAERDH